MKFTLGDPKEPKELEIWISRIELLEVPVRLVCVIHLKFAGPIIALG